MFKRVDSTSVEKEVLEGFSYLDEDGTPVHVRVYDDHSGFEIIYGDTGTDVGSFYVDDIPKLILAAQAAYDLMKGSK